jgi:O-antigen/teichoic acid export membrane protein
LQHIGCKKWTVSLRKNLSYNFLLSLGQVLFPLLSIPWLSRALDPQGLGRVQFTDSLAYFFTVLAEFGIVTHAIREVARIGDDAAALRRLVSELLSLHLLTTAVSVALFACTTWFFYSRIADPRLVVYAITFLLLNGFACEWYFWGTEQFRYIAVRTLLVRALALLLLVLLVRYPAHYTRYYAIITASAGVIVLLNLRKMLREAGFTLQKLNWSRHLRVTRITYAVSLAYSIPLMMDNVLLGLLAGTSVVPFYAYGIKITRLLAGFLADAFLVLYPRTVALLKEADEHKIRRNLRLSGDGLLLLAVPAGVGLWLVADAFSGIYFGPRFYAVAGHLRILSVFPLLFAAGLFLNKQVLMPRNREKLVLWGLLAEAVVFIGTACLLCPRYGSIGMAWTVVISEATVLTCNAVFVRIHYPGLLVIPRRTLAATLLTGLLFMLVGGLLHYAGASGLGYLAILIPVCVLIFLAILKSSGVEAGRLFFSFILPSRKTTSLE